MASVFTSTTTGTPTSRTPRTPSSYCSPTDERGNYTERTKVTFEQFVIDVWAPALDVRPSTRSSYLRNLKLHVIPTIGHQRLQAIDAPTLNRLYRELVESGRRDDKEGGLSPRTVRYVSTIVHRVFRDALAWQFVARNVATAARPPTQQQAREAAPEMRTRTGLQLGTFLEWVKADRYGPAFTFLATTGMRRGEALGLTWDDVDLDNCTVSIRRARIAVDHKATTGATKTGRSRENSTRLDDGRSAPSAAGQASRGTAAGWSRLLHGQPRVHPAGRARLPP